MHEGTRGGGVHDTVPDEGDARDIRGITSGIEAAHELRGGDLAFAAQDVVDRVAVLRQRFLVHEVRVHAADARDHAGKRSLGESQEFDRLRVRRRVRGGQHDVGCEAPQLRGDRLQVVVRRHRVVVHRLEARLTQVTRDVDESEVRPAAGRLDDSRVVGRRDEGDAAYACAH